MEEFRIELFNNSSIFYAGQTIQGKVIIDLSESKKMSSVRLKVKGKGNVHFTTTRDVQVRDADGQMRTEKETIDHWANEEYMDHMVELFEGSNLNEGHHEFPFTYIINPNAPSSFEGDFGTVRYFIQAEIVRNWLWNHKTKMHITVISILDLNQFPECSEPANDSNEKTFCCLCCASGPLSVHLATGKTGYVPGEYLIFSAEIENASRKKMKSQELCLKEITKYKSGYEVKEVERVVAEISKGEIDSGETFEWDQEALQVPSLAPTWLGGSKACGIIDVSYKLSFRVNPGASGFSLYTNVDILIGNIPLQPMFNKIQPHDGFAGGFNIPGPVANPHDPFKRKGSRSSSSSSSSSESGNVEAPAPVVYYPPPPLPDYFNAYQNLPPPTYSQSMWGQVNVQGDSDDENTHGNFNYAPVYPTYNFNRPSAPPLS